MNAEPTTGAPSLDDQIGVEDLLDGDLARALSLDDSAERGEIDRRLRSWKKEFDAQGNFDEFQLRQLVTESVRIERCQREERSRLAAIAERALRNWEADRRAEVETIALKLARSPGRWLAELVRTRQGCLWLIEQWRGLLAALLDKGALDPRQKAKALDLLGVPPIFRDGPTILDEVPGRPAPDVAALIRGEIESLEEKAAGPLTRLDEFDRKAAEAGCTAAEDRFLSALRRFEAGCRRRYAEILKTLRRTPTQSPRGWRRSDLVARQPITSETRRSATAPNLAKTNETERFSIPTPQPRSIPQPQTEATRADGPAAFPPEPKGNRHERRRAAALARRR